MSIFNVFFFCILKNMSKNLVNCLPNFTIVHNFQLQNDSNFSIFVLLLKNTTDQDVEDWYCVMGCNNAISQYFKWLMGKNCYFIFSTEWKCGGINTIINLMNLHENSRNRYAACTSSVGWFIDINIFIIGMGSARSLVKHYETSKKCIAKLFGTMAIRGKWQRLEILQKSKHGGQFNDSSWKPATVHKI